MSIECVKWAVETCPVKGPDKAVIIAIAYHAHPDGTGSYAGLNAIVNESGFARRTVLSSIGRLSGAGWLTVKYKAGPHGCNEYVLHMDSAAAARFSAGDALLKEGGTVQLPHGSVHVTHETVQLVHQDSAAAAPKPLIEPSRTTNVKASGEIPVELRSFDQILRTSGVAGYEPTEAFYSKVKGKYTTLDLEEEALKMAGWIQEQSGKGRRLNAAFILNWLKKATTGPPQLQSFKPPPRPMASAGRGVHV